MDAGRDRSVHAIDAHGPAPVSDFEDYTNTSCVYDATRSAIGVEIILGCLARARPLSDTVLLDAGCGTGNYAAALLPHVARVVGVDLNPGMLRAARLKLASAIAAGRAELHQGDLADLPLATASVDGVMVNQVLHHLPGGEAHDWASRRLVLAEFARVLRPGGVLVINACMPEQIRDGWWCFALIPGTVERLCARHPDANTYARLLREAGFSARGRMVPVDAVVQGEHYFDSHGPEHKAWRDGDSTWALASAQELEQALATLADLHARGRAQDFVREHDARREQIGQVTFLYAVRH
jgi:ubiquinone/menaquinone biosynthesis C-methylase UbiE